jgi:hypothetical protein
MQHADAVSSTPKTSHRFGFFRPEHGKSLGAYRPELPTAELILEVRKLLATERHAKRLTCRYLADLADRIRAR